MTIALLLCGVLAYLPRACLAASTEVAPPVTPSAPLAPPAPSASATPPVCAPDRDPHDHRPRVGLVLSGGGARGLAHVGVLEVLEREHIPIDCIAGTSMGAIIGGLYAGGMSAAQIEAEVLKIDWDSVFATRVERAQLSLRRKEQDIDVPPLLEFGLRDGGLRVPVSTVSSRGLEILLRGYTLAVRHEHRFDHLPIAFRTVATDMESGHAVILGEGDLALAMRASMSVPGVFAPTEVGGHILGDGGLVDNVPVDLARAMGAEVLIVSNLGTPLAGRDSLNSLAGLTAQTINILTEQNVERSLASLGPRDVLIAPELDGLSAGDFDKAKVFVAQGQAQAEASLTRLAALRVSAAEYAQWRADHAAPVEATPTLAFVQFRGSKITHPEVNAAELESRAGQPFDETKAERDAQRLAASGDYVRADYQLVEGTSAEGAAGEGLAFNLEDKPWGPNYLRMGIGLYADSRADSRFDIKLVHDRHWLDEHGSEWRNFVRLGDGAAAQTEWFRPLDTHLGPGWRPFISPFAGIDSRDVRVYAANAGPEAGRLNRSVRRVGIDTGLTWGELGEVRLGVNTESWREHPELVAPGYVGPTDTTHRRESEVRASVVLDQLDAVWFPREGWRMEAEAARVFEASGFDPSGPDVSSSSVDHFDRYQLRGRGAYSLGPHTFSWYGSVVMSDRSIAPGEGRYSLGGFQELSGYARDQLRGDDLMLLRAGYYVRLGSAPLTRGLWAGGTVEAGNTWDRRQDVSLRDLRRGYSLYIGADTTFGPLYLAAVYAPHAGGGLVLFLGRP